MQCKWSRVAGVRAAGRDEVCTIRTIGPEVAVPGWRLVPGGLGGWGGCVEAKGGTGGAGTAPVVATTGLEEAATGASGGYGWGPAEKTRAGSWGLAWQV